jgi:hypothetical protein
MNFITTNHQGGLCNVIFKLSAAISLALDNNVESIKVSYLSSHLIKILEILSGTDIIINILEFNSYNLLMIESGKFEHILFPME